VTSREIEVEMLKVEKGESWPIIGRMVKGGRNSRNSRNCFKNRAKCNLSFPNDGLQNNGLHQIKHASNLMIMELVAMKVFDKLMNMLVASVKTRLKVKTLFKYHGTCHGVILT
jgi:hypothetical protein